MRWGAGRTVNRLTAVFRRAYLLAFALFLVAMLARATTAYSFDNSEPASLAAHSLLLDAVNAGDKIVAVGDHGDVVISRDHGLTWTQIIVPTRALLTAVYFPDRQHGWIVGHDGVILFTQDGGTTWERQDDGKDRATVFLDVLFLDATRGFAVGAYGKFLATMDGGKTWVTRKISDAEVHFNQLSAAQNGTLFIAGESGTLLSSTDEGKKWHQNEVPYDGSLFGSLPLGNRTLIVYGLRGHILRSTDDGATWEPKNSEIRVLISSGLRLKSGTIVLAGQGGNFFVSHDAGENFQPWKPAGFNTSVSALVEANDGSLVTVGEAGAVGIKLP